MSGELALRLIRAIRTGTEATVIGELFSPNVQRVVETLTKPTIAPTTSTSSSSSSSTTVADDIDIVPYKCSCPYSSSSNNDNASLLKNQLKKLTKFVKNIPCDRPCPVNLYRHLRNYHKVDLQHAKDITRTIMSSKTVKLEEQPIGSDHASSTKRVKMPVRVEKLPNNHSESVLPLGKSDVSEARKTHRPCLSFAFRSRRVKSGNEK